MKRRMRFSSLCLCLFMILAFTACGGNGSGQTSGGAASGGDQGSGSVAADNTPIYIGMINSITGNYADFGVGNQWSANRAVEEINANGGVAGRRLELVFNDDEGDPTVSTTLAQKVVDDERILGLVGSFTTACSTVIAEVIDGKLCQVSGSSSSRVYTDTTDWAFSVFGLIETESRFMCRYVVYKYLGNPTVGALYSDTDFSHSSYDAFVDQAARDGVNIVDAISYSPTETDFSSIITKMQLSKPEVIVQFGTEGGINLINQIRSVGWDVPVCTFSKTANMLEQLGGNAEGQVVLSRWEFDMSNSFEAEFYNDFISDLGYEPLLQTASSYDIVYMYKQVIEELTAEGAPLTRQAVRDKIENIAFDGLTGHVVFDSGGMVERGCFIYQVENGEFVKKTDYDYIDRGYE